MNDRGYDRCAGKRRERRWGGVQAGVSCEMWWGETVSSTMHWRSQWHPENHQCYFGLRRLAVRGLRESGTGVWFAVGVGCCNCFLWSRRFFVSPLPHAWASSHSWTVLRMVGQVASVVLEPGRFRSVGYLATLAPASGDVKLAVFETSGGEVGEAAAAGPSSNALIERPFGKSWVATLALEAWGSPLFTDTFDG